MTLRSHLLLVCALACGCAPELTQPQRNSARAPDAAAVSSEVAEGPALPAVPSLEPGLPNPGHTAPPVPRAPAPPPPRDPGVLLKARHEPAALSAWARDPSSSAAVRASALRALAEAAPQDAIQLAGQLAADPSTDRHTRANAVALLARSDDPSAKRALASLAPRYQRLAAALRDR